MDRVSAIPSAAFSQIMFVPNIETAGVVISGVSLPSTAQLLFRRSGDTDWRTGHNLVRIDDGRLIGSLFGLSPSTAYDVRVVDGSTEISGNFTTQADELQFSPVNFIYVNASSSPGGDGSQAAPFRTIQEGVNRASPGTQVLVADGVYHESVMFPASGSAGNWIQVKAQGGGAILDGSTSLEADVWKPLEGKANVWFTKIRPGIKYLARDGLRFFYYDDLSGLIDGRGHNNVSMSEGWFFDPINARLYVHTNREPHKYNWQVPRFNAAFLVEGRDWVWIEGFEMRFYGTEYGCGVCSRNSSHVVIRKNRIHNLQNPVFVEWTGGEERGNDTRIEYNEMYDSLFGEPWNWNAVKGTPMESIAIVLRGHIGAIVRGNDIHHYFNGIYTSSSGALDNPGIAFDVDVYNNRIHHIGDDALEPEGTCVNHRFRNNAIDTTLVGISLAPVTVGPLWLMRSTISNYTGRSIKWDRSSDGWVFIYHNTSWTNQAAPNQMEMINPVHNSVMRNNIFQGNGYSIEGQSAGSTGHDLNYDNWFTSSGGNRFKWEGVEYATMNQLCRAAGLECNGHESLSGLANPGSGDFSLLPNSPNIDRGVILPGINDYFSGSAPDIGALESSFSTPLMLSSVSRMDANPTNAASVNFKVTFSKPVNGVDLAPPFADFNLTTAPGISGASITSVTPSSDSTFTVNVNTGSGDGTLRLDIMDDDSILDASGNPLGGVGAGNGNFTNGDSYTIEKSLLIVSGIVRTDANPNNAGQVHFQVTFSEDVSGVDAGDFVLTTTGNISNASLGEVTGAGRTYIVTVNTGSGDGTLRLDLVDNDSILDPSSTPLGGVDAGNGTFTAGEVYTVNKNAPFVTSSLRADLSPTAAGSVRFLVAFSEPVSGVDPADFVLAVSGLNDASVSAVTGADLAYVVTVSTGSGNGSLRLDLLDNDSILDAAGIPLGGAGLGNGNFATGESYAIDRTTPVIQSAAFASDAANDGWVLESKETSNKGGSVNGNATTFKLGDNSQDNQYRAILQFPTASLPDNAVITQAILTIQLEAMTGSNPFTSLRNIWVDIRQGAFGSFGPFQIGALQAGDFQAPASLYTAGMILDNPVGGWYWSNLDAKSFQFVNLKGVTQFRLGFQLDDDDDKREDTISFFSGNYSVQSARPQLSLKYYVPKK